MAASRMLRLIRPCCYAHVELAVEPGVPIQTYARRCAPCGITWAIRRETAGAGIFVDRIDWLDTTSRAYIRRVEVAPWS